MSTATPSTGGTAATTPPVEPTPVARFELPAFDFHFASLTEGTNIPPPEPSPIEVPTPPKTPTVGIKNPKTNGHSPTSNADSSTIAVKRSHDDVPVSPTLSSRGSIRRLISKTLLAGETNGVPDSPSRPESRAISVDKKSKRSSFWGRLRHSEKDSKRSSIIVKEEVALPPPTPTVVGPPPPMIPELNALESKLDVKDGGSLGSDLFKNIN